MTADRTIAYDEGSLRDACSHTRQMDCPVCALWPLDGETPDEWKARLRALAEAEREHCPNGHPWTAENIYVSSARPNERFCLACKRAAYRKYRRRRARERVSA